MDSFHRDIIDAGGPQFLDQTMRGKTLLSGHTLEFEGRAHGIAGCCTVRYGQGTGGQGHGKCSCGALSPHLGSGYQRRRWHKEHKDAVRAGRSA